MQIANKSQSKPDFLLFLGQKTPQVLNQSGSVQGEGGGGGSKSAAAAAAAVRAACYLDLQMRLSRRRNELLAVVAV